MSDKGGRSRSRSPVREEALYEISISSDESPREQPPKLIKKICIDNYPCHWSYKDIKQFIKDRIGSLEHVRYVQCKKRKRDDDGHKATIEFTDPDVIKQAYEKLKEKRNEPYEGRIITVTLESFKQNRQVNSGSYSSSRNSGFNNHKTGVQPSKTQKSHDSYGLSQDFLEHLGIRLPITNKIFIANLHTKVDEDKLKEVFSIAGQIVDVFLIVREDKPLMAKIEFDHPLEAVQAISMFHNKHLYGRAMVVRVDQSPNHHNKPLPAGLAEIGPGLGPNGAPMRGIRYAAEVQPLKEIINSELLQMKVLLNQQVERSQPTKSMAPLNVNTMSAFNQAPLPVANPFAQGIMNYQSLHGLLQQSTAQGQATPGLVGYVPNFQTQDWNALSQNNMQQPQANNSGPSEDNGSYSRPSRFDVRPRPSDEKERSVLTTDMIIFHNLPSSVTLSALKSKMQEVGEFKFAEITDGGKAIVRFLRTEDANRCVKLFDRSKVDGQTIQVKYF